MLIPITTLNRIEREIGPKPDEAIIDIYRPQTLVGDFGAKKGTPKLIQSDMPARFNYIGDFVNAGVASNGRIRTDADCVLAADRRCDLKSADIVVKKALKFKPNKFYGVGQYAMDDVNIDIMYVCIQQGNTDDSNIVFPKKYGKEFDYGTSRWRQVGECERFTVTELIAPRTYGDYITVSAYLRNEQKRSGSDG